MPEFRPYIVCRHTYLAHANCTLFFTSRAAFVCKKKTRSFRVFPPENWEIKKGGISNTFF